MRGLAEPSSHCVQRLPDSLQSYFGCPNDKIIRQSQNNEPLRPEPDITLQIMGFLLRHLMMRPIAFHDQPPLHAYEIHDIPPKGNLPPELYAKAAIAERAPEQRLGARWRVALFVGNGDGVGIAVAVRH
jgi:hypothetical protein